MFWEQDKLAQYFINKHKHWPDTAYICTNTTRKTDMLCNFSLDFLSWKVMKCLVIYALYNAQWFVSSHLIENCLFVLCVVTSMLYISSKKCISKVSSCCKSHQRDVVSNLGNEGRSACFKHFPLNLHNLSVNSFLH